METRVCKLCGIEKPLNSYYTNYRGKPFTYCRSCHRRKDDAWKKAHPEATKEVQKRSRAKNGHKFYLNQVAKRNKNWEKYSKQRQQWDKNHKRGRYELASKLEISQEGKCALCLKPFEERYDIDHSHITGLVRGLLCRKCNSGLHYFEDATFIAKASKYITDYPALKFPPTKY